MKPVTKATIHNDGDFDNPWVLSFKLPAGGATTSDAVFVEAVPTKQIAGQMIVQLSVSNEPHVLYFVAPPAGSLNDNTHGLSKSPSL